jgi:hypothetical protein
MSKKYLESPLVNHSNCRELHSPKLCAIVRKDKKWKKEGKVHKCLILETSYRPSISSRFLFD